MQQPPLPAYEIAGRLNDAISTHPTTIVTAPPGAGKSTVLPLTILESLKAKGGGKIIMIEPRRLAAIQIAARMAATIGEPVGKTVGYRVRFDTKVSETTRIEVLTEGIMTRMLIDDPTLDGTDVVIFDEFHERSLNSDTAFALTRQTQQIIRDDLRIVVMSATIDSSAICHTLHAPLVESKGRMHPVEVEYATPETEICRYSTQDIAQTVAAAITRMHDKHPGDILAFLPGQAEIRRCAELLGSSLSPTTVAPLYGNLTPREQQLAIAASEEGERKVVLATPIAETSITIEGVRIVVVRTMPQAHLRPPNRTKPSGDRAHKPRHGGATQRTCRTRSPRTMPQTMEQAVGTPHATPTRGGDNICRLLPDGTLHCSLRRDRR